MAARTSGGTGVGPGASRKDLITTARAPRSDPGPGVRPVGRSALPRGRFHANASRAREPASAGRLTAARARCQGASHARRSVDSTRMIRYPAPSTMPRVRVSVLGVVAIAAVVGVAAAAPPEEPRFPYSPSQLKRQWTPGVPPSPATQLPTAITHDDEVQHVSLKETIALALENNPGIAAQRLEPVRQDETVLGAQAQFDPTLSGEYNQNHSTLPNASALAGTPTLNTDNRNANLHLIKTFRTSTIATFDFLNNRNDQNAKFNELRPAYTPELNFSVIQPLLRNFGWDFSYLVVRVNEQT